MMMEHSLLLSRQLGLLGLGMGQEGHRPKADSFLTGARVAKVGDQHQQLVLQGLGRRPSMILRPIIRRRRIPCCCSSDITSQQLHHHRTAVAAESSESDSLSRSNCYLFFDNPLSDPGEMKKVGVSWSMVGNDYYNHERCRGDKFYSLGRSWEQDEVKEKKKVSVLKEYKSKNRLLEDLANTRCIGSSHGWLAFLNLQTLQIYLLDPFFAPDPSPLVPLPPIESFPSFIMSLRKSKLLGPSCNSELHNLEYLFYNSDHIYALPPDSIPCLHQGPLFALSSSPSSSECTVMLAFNGRLAFCRLGDSAWTALHESFTLIYDSLVYSDSKQRFYTLSQDESVEAWDLTDPSSPRRTHFQKLPPHDPHQRTFLYYCKNKYLVLDSAGEPWLAVRYYWKSSLDSYISGDDDSDISGDDEIMSTQDMKGDGVDVEDCNNDNKTNQDMEGDDDHMPYTYTMDFHFTKLDFKNITKTANDKEKKKKRRGKTEYEKQLRNRALLLDANQSALVSIRDFPDLKPNSVYLTDDYRCHYSYTGSDFGIFSLADKTLVKLLHMPEKIRSGACWVIP